MVEVEVKVGRGFSRGTKLERVVGINLGGKGKGNEGGGLKKGTWVEGWNEGMELFCTLPAACCCC